MTERVEIGNATRIYALCDPRDGMPRYIGKTVQPLLSRLIAHKRTADRGSELPVHRWIRKVSGIKTHGAFMRWIETVPAGGDWEARERFWIVEARQQGFNLLNLTEGGDGLAGLKRTEVHKQRIADSLRKGAYFSCEQCGVEFWRKPTEVEKGNCRFCSRGCYAVWQKGRSRKMPAHVQAAGIEAARAKRKAQTHCKRGHELSGENLFITTSGSRGCKECRKLHKRKYRERCKD